MRQGIKLHWLLIGVFLVNFGNSFVWPLTTIYVHNQLHQSLTMAGIVILFYSGANVVGSYYAGDLFDRKNPQRLMLIGLFAAILTMVCLGFFNGWPAYPIMLSLVGFFNGWLVTLHNSYGTIIQGHNGRLVFNMIYFANNLGMVIATSIVGPIYEHFHNQVGPLFLMTALLYSFFSIIVVRFYHVDRTLAKQSSDSKPRPAKEKAVTANATLPKPNLAIIWILCISLAIIWVMYTQWSSNLSVYVTSMGISMTKYSLLWTINGLMVVIIQPIMNYANQYLKNDYLKVAFGMTTISLSFLTLIFGRSYPWFILGMVVLTLGEIFVFPTVPAIINQLSSNEVKGHYQGILNAFISIGKAIGPVIGGLIIEQWSYHSLFIGCLFGSAVIVIFTQLTTQKIKRKTTEY